MSSGLLLVGCGKMGGALLQGWLDRGTPSSSVTIIEPVIAAAATATAAGVRVCAEAGALPRDYRPEVILLAVKPQVMDAAVAPLKPLAAPGTLVLSIAAGKTIAGFEKSLGPGAAIVRAMPNTPAAVGRGITVCCPNRQVTPAMRGRCDELLKAVGEVAWIEDEALMDPVTAVSGSGPAYVFLLIEAMAAAGAKAGLPPDLAMQLARATVCGAGELAFRAAEPAATLRQNVTSPGGTTQAALEVLMAPGGLQPVMDQAVAAATRRSRELAS